MEKQKIIEYFADIMYAQQTEVNICNFISDRPDSDRLFALLGEIEKNPLSKVQLDQLLSLDGLKNMSDDFFEYYWLTAPKDHFYKIRKPYVPVSGATITSIEQLKWGFERIFIDCLFLFGNIQVGYDYLAQRSTKELKDIFDKNKFDTQKIIKRGKALHFEDIDKNDRYLISEMACKTLATPQNREKFVELIVEAYKNAVSKGTKRIKFQDLLEGKYTDEKHKKEENYQQMSIFQDSVSETNDVVKSEKEAEAKAKNLADRFLVAHDKATKNTSLYLSLCNDLDVYVATSMRNKKDFMEMANFCSEIFGTLENNGIKLRYFDPTISAADSHEDKGLIECLMVKSARILVYSAGLKDSYGKDAEAAMALSMGKPTIFYCKEKDGKAKFYKDVHPLSRLVNFQTGVAGGVIVCQSTNEVEDILKRLIKNEMEYTLVQKENNNGFYLLKEKLTGSVVRVQTNNKLLTSAFWNNYIK